MKEKGRKKKDMGEIANYREGGNKNKKGILSLLDAMLLLTHLIAHLTMLLLLPKQRNAVNILRFLILNFLRFLILLVMPSGQQHNRILPPSNRLSCLVSTSVLSYQQKIDLHTRI